jgi:nitrate/nitrite transporter NarK
MYKTNFNQDRLGTNIGKNSTKRPFILRPIKIANNAESAVSFYNVVTNIVTILLSPLGGWLADTYDRTIVCGASLIAMRCVKRSLWLHLFKHENR